MQCSFRVLFATWALSLALSPSCGPEIVCAAAQPPLTAFPSSESHSAQKSPVVEGPNIEIQLVGIQGEIVSTCNDHWVLTVCELFPGIRRRDFHGRT